MTEPVSPLPDVFTRREPLADYLARTDHVSSSALRRFLRTGRPPELAVIADPTPREASLGDALHALLLEPDRFDESFLRLDGETRAPELRDDPAAPSGRTWLSARECTALDGMCRAIRNFARVPLGRWLETGEKELSLYWHDGQGGRWKGRPDCFDGDVILELKTSSDPRPAKFAKVRKRFGYDLQAALYLEGVGRLTGTQPRFLYVAVETVRPHTVWVIEPTPGELSAATAALADARARFRAALTTPDLLA